MLIRTSTVLCAVAALTAGFALTPSAAHASPPNALAPILTTASKTVPGSYVVMLKQSDARVQVQTSQASTSRARAAGIEITGEYPHLGSYRARLTPAQLEIVRADPQVQYVQPEPTLRRIDVKRSMRPATADDKATVNASQANPPSWGLDRIDQPNLPLDRSFTPGGTGAGVHAFIIDSGINETHVDYKDRLGESIDLTKTGSVKDCFGHGAHIAGTIAGTNYGIAKKATIHTAKIFDCKGESPGGDVAEGLDWVLSKTNLRPAVVNLSLISEADTYTDDAVQRAIDKGLIVAVAGGNYSKDACTMSPSRLPAAITVGNVNQYDAKGDSSNFGRCIDLFAPGELIKAPYINSSTEIETLSGTSMSTPHVVGAAALYLQSHPQAKQKEVSDALVGAAARDKLTKLGAGSPNLLLQVTGLSSGEPGPKPTPTPKPTSTPTSGPTASPTAEPTVAPTHPGEGGSEFSNNVAQPIGDYKSVTSSIRSTKAGAQKVTVTIDVSHPCSEHLAMWLTSPDGTRNILKRATYVSARNCTPWNGPKSDTYTMRSDTKGEWKLEVSDNQRGSTGTLNSWKISFS